jgi:hypothetical protein
MEAAHGARHHTTSDLLSSLTGAKSILRGTGVAARYVLETIPADPLFAPSYAERRAFMEFLRILLEPCCEWIPAG